MDDSGIDGGADAGATRVAHGHGVVGLEGRGQRHAALVLVRRRHHDHVRDAAQVGQVVVACVGRTVGADQVVATRIVPAGGEPTRIDYVMRRGPAGWRAVDVLLNGSISQVAVQRSDFRTSVATGDASALIASLQRKVAELSGGAIPS